MDRATGFAPDPIKDAIAATKGFQGATGTITIDSNRNAQKPVVVVQIKNGKFTCSSTASGG
jgi:branched-chain amino acid transport system substrate-binding protein